MSKQTGSWKNDSPSGLSGLWHYGQYRNAACCAASKERARILQPKSYKSRLKRMWEGRGASYDAGDTFHQALALELVRKAGIKPGEKLLDVATGTGMVAIPAAQLTGKTGSVTGIDISESMLDQARLLPYCSLCNTIVGSGIEIDLHKSHKDLASDFPFKSRTSNHLKGKDCRIMSLNRRADALAKPLTCFMPSHER